MSGTLSVSQKEVLTQQRLKRYCVSWQDEKGLSQKEVLTQQRLKQKYSTTK